MTTILHLIPAHEFSALAPDQDYLPPNFAADGFIHCTGDEATLVQVANRFYRQLPGEFLVLVIDPTRLKAEVKWEAPAHPDGSSAPLDNAPLFPHIYGPLNREAIVTTRVMKRGEAGAFEQVMDKVNSVS